MILSPFLVISTYFWTDWWVGDAPLCEKYHRLFDLSIIQKVTNAEMFVLGWSEGGEAWKWCNTLNFILWFVVIFS